MTEQQATPTVKANWNMQCPQCGSDENIDINVEVMVRLLPEGTDADQAANNHQNWHDNSSADCTCGFSGTVIDFDIDNQEG
jgi:hypothetical protein